MVRVACDLLTFRAIFSRYATTTTQNPRKAVTDNDISLVTGQSRHMGRKRCQKSLKNSCRNYDKETNAALKCLDISCFTPVFLCKLTQDKCEEHLVCSNECKQSKKLHLVETRGSGKQDVSDNVADTKSCHS